MTINLNSLKQALCFATNIKTKGKVNIMSDVYVNTSVAAIWNNLAANTSVDITRNGFFEVSQTGKSSPWLSLIMTSPRN